MGICRHGREKFRCKECGGTQRKCKPQKAAVKSLSPDPDTAHNGDDDNGKCGGKEKQNYGAVPLQRLLGNTARPIQAAMPGSKLQLGAVGEGLDLHSQDEASGGAAHMD